MTFKWLSIIYYTNKQTDKQAYLSYCRNHQNWLQSIYICMWKKKTPAVFQNKVVSGVYIHRVAICRSWQKEEPEKNSPRQNCENKLHIWSHASQTNVSFLFLPWGPHENSLRKSLIDRVDKKKMTSTKFGQQCAVDENAFLWWWCCCCCCS